LNRVPRIDIILREPFLKEQRAVIAPPQHPESLSFVSCGKPLAEHDIRIVNENGEEMPEREVGSLQFTGPSAMQGYYRNVEASQAIFHEGWWDSGDFAYIAEGEVYITGRKKDIIIKAGRNFYPQEIEEVTAEINGVRKGCVIAFGVNDPKWGTERLIIVAESVETQKEKQNQMVNDIIEKVSVVLAISPDEIVLVPLRTLPKTSSGKLQRSLCKEDYLQGKLTKSKLPVGLQIAKLFIKGLWIKLGRALKKGLQFLYSLYIGLLLIFFTPCFLFSTFIPRHMALRSCKALAKMFLVLGGSTIQVIGRENLLKYNPMIFIANHASYIDSLILLSILPSDVAFVGKIEIQNWPLIGRLIQKLGYLTIDRMDFTKSLLDTTNIIQCLKEKRSVIIYPEGTFTHSPGLRPFKLGAFKIAVDTTSPLCPIALNGTRQVLQEGLFQLNRPNIQITIAEPLLPLGEEWNEVSRLHSLARRAIEKHCGELTIDLLSASIKEPIYPDAKP
jgi:1-acyl-sn-glycerol-3-phosphate acyltransferase